ncbi:MAG: Hsp20/alpha crystallin family [Candidatus Dependentiae bacterium]|nr:Hsp20/alpha crystallin family [Candidatus Dependentiae bacterium]
MNKKLFIALTIATGLTPTIVGAWPFGHHHHGGFGFGFGLPFFEGPVIQEQVVAPYPQRTVVVEHPTHTPIQTDINFAHMTSKIEDGHYVYRFAVPGHTRDQISVRTDKNHHTVHVTVRGQEAEASENSGEGFVSNVFSSSSHEQAHDFNVPADADLGSVSPKVKNGMLTITIGRLAKAALNDRRQEVPVEDGDSD